MLLLVLLLSIAFISCKKNKVAPAAEPDPVNSGAHTKQVATTNRTFLTNDSLFLYAKEVYYWNDALPDYDTFVPRNYGTDYDKELFDITRYKLDPGTGKPYEYRTANPTYPKYSYIEDVDDRNPSAIGSVPNSQLSVDLEGNGNDIGIYNVKGLTDDDITYKLYILAVDKNSPADLSGLTRGAYITNINGTSIGSVANYSAERNLVNSTILNDVNSVSLTGYKANGTAFSVTLKKTVYKSNPVYNTNVLTVGSKKIGYLAYARFSNEDNSFAALNSAFGDFYTQGVTDLVIDLRYNGGGYINTARQLINLIAPSTATGVMYKEYFNSTMQNNKATIMKNQPYLDANDKVQYKNGRMMNYFDDVDYSVGGNTYQFSKKGSLAAITNIVFIVTGNTASASELVINSLKPKMNVKLVGQKTYGKPVGFFPVRIQNKYDVFYSMFETKNSLDQGGYFSGMTPDVTNDQDYGNYDFGNPLEKYIAAAIKILVPTGTTTGVVSRNRIESVSATLGANPKMLGGFDQPKEFIGMIESRPKAKP